MTEHYESRKVRINSAMRWKDGQAGQATKFTIDFQNQFGLENVKKLIIKSWSLPNMFFNIDEYRNTLYLYDLDDNNAIVPITIPIGNYNVDTLVTALQSALNAAALPEITGATVTSDSNGLLTITLTSTNDHYRFVELQRIHVLHTDGVKDIAGNVIQLPSLNYIIGVAPDYAHPNQPTAFDGTEIVFMFDAPVSLGGLQQVFLCLDNVTSFNTIDSSGKANSAADELSLVTTPYGFSAFKECADAALAIFHWDHSISIRTIQLSIQDAWNNLLTLPYNADIIVNMKIYY